MISASFELRSWYYSKFQNLNGLSVTPILRTLKPLMLSHEFDDVGSIQIAANPICSSWSSLRF